MGKIVNLFSKPKCTDCSKIKEVQRITNALLEYLKADTDNISVSVVTSSLKIMNEVTTTGKCNHALDIVAFLEQEIKINSEIQE